MRLAFTRELPVTLAHLWPLLTDPSAMNTWSSARIEARGEHARTVHLRVLGIQASLEETLLDVDPPHRLVYSVVRGGGLRRHRGEQRLEPIPGGTRLTWTIDFAAWVPGAEYPMAVILRRELGASLDRLLLQVTPAPPTPAR